MLRNLSILAFLMFFCATGVFSQGRPEWIGKLESTIKQKEPQWKMGDHLVTNDEPELYSESIRFTKAGVTGAIQISVYKVLDNPIETFRGLGTANDNILTRSKKTPLSGLGDEGYMWADANPAAHATILFRKGKTFVSVFLPGKESAQRFAKHVADQMP